MHQALADDDPFAMVAVQALAGIGFEHGRRRFLDLQEDRVVVRGHEERDAAQGADAADADDLHRHVAEMEAIEQGPKVLGQRFAVTRECFLVARLQARRLLGRRMKDQRRIVLDPRRRPAMFGELGEQELRHVLFPDALEALL